MIAQKVKFESDINGVTEEIAYHGHLATASETLGLQAEELG